MTVEKDIHDLLESIVPKAYPDVAPMGVVPPYACYQQVGGISLTFLGKEVPSKKHGRFQITVWSKTRAEASALSLTIENAFMLANVFDAEPLGSAVAEHEDVTNFRGARQDFGIWSAR